MHNCNTMCSIVILKLIISIPGASRENKKSFEDFTEENVFSEHFAFSNSHIYIIFFVSTFQIE